MASRIRKIIPTGALSLAACLGFSQMVFAEPDKGKGSIVERELQKRRAAVEEGQTLLLKGDEAYQAGNFQDAVSAYSGAASVFQQSPATLELKQAASQRYGQASVELSKQLVQKGQLKEARQVLQKVLADDPAQNDPQVLAALQKLDDPIQTNPALTGEHAANVDEVRRLLYLAQGAYDLGKYDESERHYTEIIRIDPHNQAARRGMERVNVEKAKYYSHAQNHTRAEILMEVERGWELDVKPNTAAPELAPVQDSLPQDQVLTLKNKISRIMIPQFILDEGNLTEAIELLTIRAAENDNLEMVPTMKGINITTNLGNPDDIAAKRILDQRFSLRLTNVSVEALLKYITEATGTSFRYDDFAVTISFRGASGNTMISRTYRVPPDFISNLTAGGQAANNEPQDIFNTAPGGVGEKLAKRMGAQEALMQQGVSFPTGASASLNPSTNTLLVVNTMSNHDVIEQIINAVVETEPVIVTIKTKILKVEQNVLEELGFDWMLNEFDVGGNSVFLSGGTQDNGAQINDFPDFDGNDAAENPITAGNRTGDFAFPADKLDSLIASGISRSAQQNKRAPGVVGVSGVVNSTTIQMLMRGLDRNKGADIMATPIINTRNGQAASITIAREFIYPVAYDPPDIPQAVSGGTGTIVPSFPSEYETKELGVLYEVLPTVDEKRQFVDIAIKPTISDLEGFVNYGSPVNFIQDEESIELSENPILMPVFNVKQVDTNVVIADGSTIVIGGLLKDTVSTINDKTPVLGDLPLVGRLFQSQGIKRNSIAILFFVTVELVDPTGKPYRSR